MNVFYIPSWYPEKNNLFAGLFFKDQAYAIAEKYADVNLAVSLISDSNYTIVFKKPFKSILKTLKYLGAEKQTNSIKDNLTELFWPALLYTKKLKGFDKKIIKANEKNFIEAEKKFGKMDIIHCHVSFPAGYAGMKISEKYNVPFVITEHMGPFPFGEYIKDGKLSYRIEEPIRKANKIIAVSNALAESIKSFGFDSPDVIPNIIDEDFFTVKKEPLKKEKFVFFTLAGMIESKGIGDLIMSIKSVTKTHNNVVFKIGGTGECLESYKQLSEKENVSNYIEWLGELSREKILSEYQGCDCFILTSKHESFGVVYAEAAACGKPIIATKCGGPEDIVNKENGLLVEVGNIDEISTAISFMINNKGKFNSHEIRKDFLSRFSKEVVTEKIVKIYRECING